MLFIVMLCFSAAKTPGDLVKEMEEKKLVLNRKVCPMLVS